MILDSIKYERQGGQFDMWSVEGKDGNLVKFDNINLIVGKNAAGKSRLLEAIRKLAALLSLKEKVANTKYSLEKYSIILKENTDLYDYLIEIQDHKIVNEILLFNGVEKYNRKEKFIYSEEEKKSITLNIDSDMIITSLKDNLEFPYIAEIFEWSNALKKYLFANQYEKNNLLKEDFDFDSIDLNSLNSSDSIIQLFAKGIELFGDEFTTSIMKDFKKVGYDTNAVILLKKKSGIGIAVQEDELNNLTDQLDMSQGMFRLLSLIIQLNFGLLSKASICLLIDDLGEGLDFSRSKSMIDLLIFKIEGSDIQIFITTNDRYIMNKIPLKYWSVVERKSRVSYFHNYHNSKNIFDDFKYTGLSNFDFLATNFYLNGFENESQL